MNPQQALQPAVALPATASRGVLRQLAAAVAAIGWLSLHLWPSLGLPAEVPGTEAADLRLRQLWLSLIHS